MTLNKVYVNCEEPRSSYGTIIHSDCISDSDMRTKHWVTG